MHVHPLEIEYVIANQVGDVLGAPTIGVRIAFLNPLGCAPPDQRDRELRREAIAIHPRALGSSAKLRSAMAPLHSRNVAYDLRVARLGDMVAV